MTEQHQPARWRSVLHTAAIAAAFAFASAIFLLSARIGQHGPEAFVDPLDVQSFRPRVWASVLSGMVFTIGATAALRLQRLRPAARIGAFVFAIAAIAMGGHSVHFCYRHFRIEEKLGPFNVRSLDLPDDFSTDSVRVSESSFFLIRLCRKQECITIVAGVPPWRLDLSSGLNAAWFQRQ